MASEPVNPHDAFFKQYLSYPQVAADFLRRQLPAEVVELLDLTELQLVKDSFVDERLRTHFSDLVYRTMTKMETPIALSLLFEHKSYPDEWVNFQILRYQVNLWQQEFDQIQAEERQAREEARTAPQTKRRRTPKQRTLTPILVLLVYHGQQEWKASLRFAHHLTGMTEPESPLAQVLARYVPDFEPHFVNLTAMSDEEIQGEIATRLFLVVLKHIFEHGLGGHLDEILEMAAEIMRQPSGMGMVVTLLRYIGRSGIQVDKNEVAQKLSELLPKEGGVLMQTMAEEWIEEGKLRTLRTMVLRILRRRFSPDEELLQQIEQQVVRIQQEDDLNQLIDLALEVMVLPDFARKLQGVVPA